MQCNLKNAMGNHNRNRKLINRMYFYRTFSYAMITLALLLNILLVYYMRRKTSPGSIIHFHAYSSDDVSCHALNDSLLPTLSDSITSDKRIFFHETTCKGGLDSRQACAVESAAKANPHWIIEVIFLGPIHKIFLEGQIYKALANKSNVKFSRVHLVSYAKDTPLGSQMTSDMLYMIKEKRVERLSDVMRFITLYKYGGVYLDLDVVVVKSFDTLARNWAVKQTPSELGAGALGFSGDKLGRAIANATVYDILYNSNPFMWGDSTEGVLKRSLKKICSTDAIFNMSAAVCQGLEIYDKVYFYPVEWQFADDYLLQSSLTLSDTYTTYAHHMWNAYDDKTRIPKRSRYAKLAKLFCPNVFHLYGDEFGI